MPLSSKQWLLIYYCFELSGTKPIIVVGACS